jgi:hypothetical protein
MILTFFYSKVSQFALFIMGKFWLFFYFHITNL